MLVKRRRGWEIPGREATPEAVFHDRRRLVQAMGLGLVHSLTQIREIIRQSVGMTTYEPKEVAKWDDAYERFRRLLPA